MKCTPVMGRAFAFYVQSRSGGEDRFVDWLGEPPTCTCPDWGMKHRAYQEANRTPYLCAHLQAAKDHTWNEILEHTKEQLLAK